MTAKIINAFGRKGDDPAQAGKEVAVPVCEGSLFLVREVLRMVKSGELRDVGVIALAGGGPMTALSRSNGETVADLALLNLAADTLKDQVLHRVNDYMRPGDIAKPDDEPEQTDE